MLFTTLSPDIITFFQMLSVYGRRHIGYGVTDSMLDLMSDCFIVAIQQPLEDSWTKDVEESWRALFRLDPGNLVNPRDFIVTLQKQHRFNSRIDICVCIVCLKYRI